MGSFNEHTLGTFDERSQPAPLFEGPVRSDGQAAAFVGPGGNQAEQQQIELATAWQPLTDIGLPSRLGSEVTPPLTRLRRSWRAATGTLEQISVRRRVSTARPGLRDPCATGLNYEWPKLGRCSATSDSAARKAPSSPSCWATNTPMTWRHTSGTLTPRISAIRFSPTSIDVDT